MLQYNLETYLNIKVKATWSRNHVEISAHSAITSKTRGRAFSSVGLWASAGAAVYVYVQLDSSLCVPMGPRAAVAEP
jgi:hypothetical protein